MTINLRIPQVLGNSKDGWIVKLTNDYDIQRGNESNTLYIYTHTHTHTHTIAVSISDTWINFISSR